MATKKNVAPAEVVEEVVIAPANPPWVGIQKMLKADWGYQGAIDSVAGFLTVAAMQKMLRQQVSSTVEISGRESVFYWADVQRWLNKYYEMDLTVTGVQDEATRVALQIVSDSLI